MENIIQKIYDYTLEEIMGDRFGRYSKYIIQDRAIPDVRDGLKPVQRRILYAMYRTKKTYDKDYYKSASTVGEVIGKYHPHGDSSIYEAMVRMSQPWKMRIPHIDMHGNNGSIDGDGAAAMRYTEARLSKLSGELLRDIDKNTIAFAPNFDDKELEPTVLPARYPNLLVNGAMGISAGYATNIPPHNLGEVIDATIYRIDNPNCRLETIMNIVKGPDFPTGGIIEGIDGIRSAYETGKGKIIVKAKTKIEKNKIIVTEIPYDVFKINIVRKIDEIRIDKKIDGIIEVRDETDKDGLQITIELKKDANPELILAYLFKNTELQTTYNFNMLAIVDRRPQLFGILGILDAYIRHQKEIVYKRSEFDLAHAKARYHIVEGLIKAVSILDEVIKTIRVSKNKADSKENLMIKFDFTEEQAEAIVTLQLYRLSNTDIVLLEEEQANLTKIINYLEEIIKDEGKLMSVIKEELRRIKKEYTLPRLTEIKERVEEIKIDNTLMLPKEDVYVVLTNQGYIKRVSSRGYLSNNGEETQLKENDYVIGLYSINTLDTILLFTNLGNYLYIPVYEIPDAKWKDLGKHVSNIISLGSEEKIIKGMPVYDFNAPIYITSFSKNGMVKRTKLNEFKVQRYSKPINMMKLKDKDEIINVSYDNKENIFIATQNGYGLWYKTNEVSPVGIKAAGVKSINLKNDTVVSGELFDNTTYISIITDKGTAKRLKFEELEQGTRANRGTLLMKEIKSNPSKIVNIYLLSGKENLGIVTDNYIKYIKINDIAIMDRFSNGSYIVKDKINATFKLCDLITKDSFTKKEEKDLEEPQKEVSLEEVDSKMFTIDDILKNINKK
ncbi:MAG: DNA topoisomerase IV subunit A [Tenericutes bacterium]|nr:DNA topoisomerase IV subunit A [Mycoplasmatota bacterium]